MSVDRQMNFLNVGCGGRCVPSWTNVDFAARPPSVLGHDLRTGLPFHNAQFSFVYSSHVIEHFSRVEGKRLIAEMFRVLKPGGTVRVVVPDLERLALNYLQCLTEVRANPSSKIAMAKYEWSNLTILDQCNRHSPGGEMIEFLQRYRADDLLNVFDIEGSEIRSLHALLNSTAIQPAPTLRIQSRVKGALRRVIKRLQPEGRLRAKDQAALQVGRFRLSGEVHRAMYDEISLSRALTAAGFSDPIRLTAGSSRALSCWCTIPLDVEPDGSVYKPLSLFMEAKRL